MIILMTTSVLADHFTYSAILKCIKIIAVYKQPGGEKKPEWYFLTFLERFKYISDICVIYAGNRQGLLQNEKLK